MKTLLAGNLRNVQHPCDRDATTVATPVATSAETTENPEATASGPQRSGADNSQPPASEGDVASPVSAPKAPSNSLADTLEDILPYPCPESVEQVILNSEALLIHIRNKRK